MRSNLLSLKNTSSLIDMTQNRLSTGNKVNSAIDNPSSYYTARSLNNRANDLTSLLDSMGQAVSTIKAATEAMESGLIFLEQAISVTEQTLSNAKIEPMQDRVELVDNSAELLATGKYTEVNSSTSLDQIRTLLATDNAKIVLSDDVNLAAALTISGNNVEIIGSGHKLTLNSLTVSGANANISNIEIEGRYATTLINTQATATDFKLSNARLTNDYSGYHVGLDMHGASATIENVSINITNQTNTRNFGIIARSGANIDISGLQLYQNSRDDSCSLGILAQGGSNTTINEMSMKSDKGIAIGLFKDGGSVSGVSFPAYVKGEGTYPESWFNGEQNTNIILDALGDGALAAKAANDYAVGTEAEFGQGTWYLPAMGELMDMYGYDYDKITAAGGTSGAVGDNKAEINEALQSLKDQGVDAETLSGYLWSSSENFNDLSWILDAASGYRSNSGKYGGNGVRCFRLLENCFNPLTLSADAPGGSGAQAPKVGDIMYTDKTWSSADDYSLAENKDKTIAGVVVSVGDDDGSVKIMSIKNVANTKWSTSYVDIPELENKDYYALQAELNPSVSLSIDELNKQFASIEDESYQNQYNEIIRQYDNVINDASYKGVNLLKGDALNVRFNEDGSSDLGIVGKDMGHVNLGLNEAKWEQFSDVATTVTELKKAVSAVRSFVTELGNNYSIVQTRENFTENLINVLTEGADKLTLADMNEESANILALQTRQQLAINSLSLAAQSAQAVLKLF